MLIGRETDILAEELQRVADERCRRRVGDMTREPDPTAIPSWHDLLLISDESQEIVCETDTDGIIAWVSGGVSDILDRDPDELTGTLLLDLIHQQDLHRAEEALGRVITSRESQRVKVRLALPSGRHRRMTALMRPLPPPHEPSAGALVLLRRDRSGVALRALATLSQANRVLVRAEDEDELLQKMCRAIAHTGQYPLVWFGRKVLDAEKSVQVVAAAGSSVGYLDTIKVSWGDDPLGRGPTGRAIKSGTTQVLEMFDDDPHFTPWLNTATKQGFACSIAMPIMVSGTVEGALMVYADEIGAFDPQALNLLEDLAADLGYGITRLREACALASAATRVADSERRYRLLAENSSDVVLLADSDRRFQWVSASASSLFGWNPEDLLGHPPEDFIHPDDLPALMAGLDEADGGKGPLRLRYRFRCADGNYLWVSASGRNAVDPEGHSIGRVVALRDIHDQVQAESELLSREQQYLLLAENASDVVWQVSPDGKIIWASESVTRQLGWTQDKILGHGMELIHPEDRDRAITGRHDVIRGQVVQGEFRIARADGSWQWMALNVRAAPTPQGIFRIIAMRNVEDEVAARAELAHAIGHDALTGLSTRSSFLNRASTALGHLSPGAVSGVLCAGVDNLRAVNDAATYAVGDIELERVASRITRGIGDPDRVGRGSGDEFLILIPQLTAASDAADTAQRVVESVRGALTIAGHTLHPSVSVGIATGGPGSDPDRLIRDAALAMQQAKREGKDRWSFFDPTLAADAQARLNIEADIRVALQSGEFVPWLQPIVSLATRDITGYESLVRWIRAEASVVTPDKFLPIAERTGQVADIDQEILTRSVEWLTRIPAQRSVAVNVSPTTLARLGTAELVGHLLAESGVDPQRLHLEVTETTLLEISDNVRDEMRRIANMGVRWYVDDFGTGYSSISHLRDLPIAGLKLDRSFTSGLDAQDQTCLQLAAALSGLAHGLALDTVAEGVETRQQAALLTEQGWVHAQGWLYAAAAAEPLESVEVPV